MNRESKFRVWIERDKRMGIARTLNEWLLASSKFSLDCGHLCDSEGLLYLEYTGLKDVDGVEIYEGDILQWRDRLVEGQPIGEPNLQVQYWDGGFVMTSKEERDYLHLKKSTIERNQARVIGNIFENPELL